MSKTALFALLLAVLGGVAHAQFTDTCPAAEESTTATATATASASATSSSQGGRCAVESVARGGAAAVSTGDCFNQTTIYADGGDCRRVDVVADAECFAKAAAAAYAEAAVQVDCEGESVGCGFAEAEARATACALAKSIVDVAVFLDTEDEVCQTGAAEVATAIATAAAEAQAECCSRGSCSDADFEFAGAVQETVVRAIAGCWVYCDGFGPQAKTAEDTDVDTASKEVEIGGGQAETGSDK